ncbi:MAG: hypothetical protein ACREP5_07630 [Candidatus Binatia bacterium]
MLALIAIGSPSNGQGEITAAHFIFAIAADVAPETSPAEPPAVRSKAEISKEPTKSSAPAKPAIAPKPPTTPPIGHRQQPKPVQTPPVEQAKASEAKSQSILQMLEGHETEVKIGLIIAAFAFILGWVCGLGYYERRERKWRHKLRF